MKTESGKDKMLTLVGKGISPGLAKEKAFVYIDVLQRDSEVYEILCGHKGHNGKGHARPRAHFPGRDPTSERQMLLVDAVRAANCRGPGKSLNG
jgi:hypothetical protein